MFIVDSIKLIIAIIITFFTADKYLYYLPKNINLSDWTMSFIANHNAIILGNLLILIELFLLGGPIKNLSLNIISNKKNAYKYDITETLFLIIMLIIVVYSLYYFFNLFLILPIFTFIFIILAIKIIH